MNPNLDENNGKSECLDSFTELNAGTSDPTDGKKRYQWRSCYPEASRKEMRWEAVFLFLIYFFSLFILYATWRGWISLWFSATGLNDSTLKKYAYYAAAGMHGGIIFGMKYFYRVIARGGWHQDRRYWRIMSPFIAMSISIIVGAMIDGSVMTTHKPVNGASVVSVGFLAGYFADEAVGKMYEIASVIFGKSTTTKDGDGKSQDEKKSC